MEFREQDFKYIVQSFSDVYMGARLTYEEAAEHEDMPGKLKSAVYRMIYNSDVNREETIGEHLLRLNEKDMGYLFYTQLKIKIKVLFPKIVVDKKGVEKEKAVEKIYSIKEFVQDEALKKEKDSFVIQEISFSKLYLGALSV